MTTKAPIINDTSPDEKPPSLDPRLKHRAPSSVISRQPGSRQQKHNRQPSAVSGVMTSQPKPYEVIRPNCYVPEEILKPYLKNNPEPIRKWTTPFCECGQDTETCCLVLFCLPCVECSISKKMGEGLCMPLFVPLARMALRIKLRTKYRIQGSIASDCLASICCPHCAVCQLKREVDFIEKTRQEWI